MGGACGALTGVWSVGLVSDGSTTNGCLILDRVGGAGVTRDDTGGGGDLIVSGFSNLIFLAGYRNTTIINTIKVALVENGLFKNQLLNKNQLL